MMKTAIFSKKEVKNLIYTLPFLIIASYTDMISHKIKNYITFPMMLMGLGLNIYLNGLKGVQLSLGGMISAFGLSLLIYMVIRSLGMGDIKLLMGLGSFVGTEDLFFIYLYALVLFLLVQMITDKSFFNRLERTIWSIKIYTETKTPIQVEDTGEPKAFAPYILAGTILALVLNLC